MNKIRMCRLFAVGARVGYLGQTNMTDKFVESRIASQWHKRSPRVQHDQPRITVFQRLIQPRKCGWAPAFIAEGQEPEAALRFACAAGAASAIATGIALIAVSPSGENQIVVAPGANRALVADMLDLPSADALICQLEVPVNTLKYASKAFDGFFCINLAPALEVPAELIQRADLVVVNETEAEYYGDALAVCGGLVAITYGAQGAVLREEGEVLAESKPPVIDAVDATGAGDTFTAALTVAIVEGQELQAALRFACAAGAASATKSGSQPSLPFRQDVEDLISLTGDGI